MHSAVGTRMFGSPDRTHAEPADDGAKHVKPKTTFRERAARSELNDAELLNSNNSDLHPPTTNVDVAVVGGGIHGLIYAIHARCFAPKQDTERKRVDRQLRISVFEKASRPSHKSGESTLPPLAMWLKMLGFEGDVLLRIFGLKDGLSFYTLDKYQPREYTYFASSGPPGLLLAGFQIERSTAELFLTMLAQRRGVNVYHGRTVDIESTRLSADGNVVPVQDNKGTTSSTSTINCPLVIDATGRFRRYTSKASRIHRFAGWNTDAYWAYFACKDETDVPLRGFEGSNTNHICFPEGWAWVIRLASWQSSPLANLMDLINYLIDHAEAGTASDSIPSMYELAQMFDCKVRWVWSIGYAIRDDICYPERSVLETFGSCEAERKFNWITSKYVKLQEFMSSFELIHNLYGPGSTWKVRKSLAFASNIVSGDGWAAVGDALGFTNPLHSPGINVAVGSTGLAAELTHQAFICQTKDERRHVWAGYDAYVIPMLQSLELMNRFNVCFLWQYLAGIGNPGWRWKSKGYSLDWDNWTDYICNWLWGSRNPEYIAVACNTLRLLDGPFTEKTPSPELIKEVIDYSNAIKCQAISSKRFDVGWANVLRSYNDALEYDVAKYDGKDRFARLCKHCHQWYALRADWHMCSTCGKEHMTDDREIEWDPPLGADEVTLLLTFANPKGIGRAMDVLNDVASGSKPA